MEEYYLDRHRQLWEENNKALKRIALLTVTISIALIVKVLIPYVNESESKRPTIERIEVLKTEKEKAENTIKLIGKTESVLQDINKYIARKPWQKDKKELINRYEHMNESRSMSGYSRHDYQTEADKTVNNISENLHTKIITPLQSTIPEEKLGEASVGHIKTEVDALKTSIEDWQQKYIGKRWYDTIAMKESAMEDLAENLGGRLNNFSSVVKDELEKLKLSKENMDKEITSLNDQIDSEGDKLKQFDEELEKILPQWLQGLVTIEQVIQLLPVVLFGVTLYIFAIGVILTRHYKIYTAGMQFSEGLVREPSMSSAWTMIPRGTFGTVQTIISYTLLFILIWLLLEKSIALLRDWLSIDAYKAWVGASKHWEYFLWLCRAGFAVFLACIAIIPWRGAKEKSVGV